MRISDWSSDVCSSDLLDAGGKQSFEDIEQDLLHGDGERQHPVEEGADAGQVITQTAIVVGKFEAGHIFEGAARAALPLATRDQPVELNERVPTIKGFDLVIRSEHVLPACLPLPQGQRLPRIKTSAERRNDCTLHLTVAAKA